MAVNLNVVTLAGNLGQDPEFRSFPSGGGLARLRMAVTKRYQAPNKEWKTRTSWFAVEVSGGGADFARDNLRKGDAVLVHGELEEQTWDDKTTGAKRSAVLVRAHMVQLMGAPVPNDSAREEEAPERQAPPPKAAPRPKPTPRPPPPPADDEADDDIPF